MRFHKWNTSFFVLSWLIWPFINRVSQIPPEKSQKRTSYRKSDKRACLQSETRTLNIIITFLWSPCTGRYYEILCSGLLINKSETKYVLEVHIVQFLQESIVRNVLLKKKKKNLWVEFFKLCWPNFLLNLHMRVSHSQFHKQDLQKETDSTYQPILLFVPIPLISLQLTRAIRSFHCFPTHTQHQFASLVYTL